MRQSKAMCTAILLFALTGCGSSGNDGMVIAPPPPPPPPPAATDFTTFVKGQFAATSDMTDPVEVDDEDFAFSDDDNPMAYDDLLL